MSRRSSSIRGVTKLRKFLRRVEPNIASGVKDAINRAAKTIHFDALKNADRADYGKLIGIREYGDMIASIGIKYGRDGLTAVIGPGAEDLHLTGKTSIRGKEARWNFNKGLWAEFGTKGDPKRNIPRIPPAPFMNPAYEMNAKHIQKDVHRAVEIALERAASG